MARNLPSIFFHLFFFNHLFWNIFNPPPHYKILNPCPSSKIFFKPSQNHIFATLPIELNSEKNVCFWIFFYLCYSVYFEQAINKIRYYLKAISKLKQEVGDKLSFCMLKLLPQVSSLVSLVAISIVKVEI